MSEQLEELVEDFLSVCSDHFASQGDVISFVRDICSTLEESTGIDIDEFLCHLEESIK